MLHVAEIEQGLIFYGDRGRRGCLEEADEQKRRFFFKGPAIVGSLVVA